MVEWPFHGICVVPSIPSASSLKYESQLTRLTSLTWGPCVGDKVGDAENLVKRVSSDLHLIAEKDKVMCWQRRAVHIGVSVVIENLVESSHEHRKK